MGRSRFGLAICIVSWTTGCAAIALWLVQSRQPQWQAGVACGEALAAGVWALASWRRSARGQLAWTGNSWTWTPSAPAGVVPTEVAIEVSVDVQRCLLLRLQLNEPGRTRAGVIWAWLERADDPARWNDVRRAVYSRAKPDALPGAPSAQAAKP